MRHWKASEAPKPRPAFLGLALVTIGVLFLLRELEVLPDISLWTMVWLGLGGWLLVGTLAGNRKGWFWPLSLLGIGTAMLIRDLSNRDFRLWPIIVIAIGLSILLQSSQRDREQDPNEI